MSGILVFAGTTIVAEGAAREFMPPEVARVTGAACDPPCLLCHTDMMAKSDNAMQPFVLNLKRYAFSIYKIDPETGELTPNPEDFDRALTAWEGDTDVDLDTRGDTDGDGLSDREELMYGRDPNPNGVSFCGEGAPPEPTYGCAARVAPRGDIDAGAFGAAALVALGLISATRAARRRPHCVARS